MKLHETIGHGQRAFFGTDEVKRRWNGTSLEYFAADYSWRACERVTVAHVTSDFTWVESDKERADRLDKELGLARASARESQEELRLELDQARAANARLVRENGELLGLRERLTRAQGELERLRAIESERDSLRDRLRTTAQILIGVLGSTGAPENAEEAAGRAAVLIRELRGVFAETKEAFEAAAQQRDAIRAQLATARKEAGKAALRWARDSMCRNPSPMTSDLLARFGQCIDIWESEILGKGATP